MKIIVAIKQVPARDSQLRIAPSGKWIEEADLSYEINEPDAYALEAGLQLKEKHGGEVVALCAGPARAASHHPRSAGQRRRPRHPHRRRHGGLRSAGRRATAGGGGEERRRRTSSSPACNPTTWGYGQTGVILAELLGVPHATIVMQVEAREGGSA
jgi:electron transfer flavoprotein beta subunit